MSKKSPTIPPFSQNISNVCELMEAAVRDYAWSGDQVHRMDELTQDLLHKLELEGLDYRERAKVATKLQKCRQLRRAYKDTCEILEPLVQLLNSERGRNMMNLLREALGKTRKAESRMENRTYYPRVLRQDAKDKGAIQ